MANIFFDLDGTLIESRPRLYRLFQYMVPRSKLSFDEYWALKRNKIAHNQILKDLFSYTAGDIKKFEDYWLKQIERPEWLIFDKPFEGVSDFLKEFKKNQKVFIVTSRQSEKMAFDQIERFGWLKSVDRLLVTGKGREKHDLISHEVKVNSEDWIVGDTGKDVQTGKQLGVKTAGVLSGFMNEEKLREYNPDIILKDVLELKINQ